MTTATPTQASRKNKRRWLWIATAVAAVVASVAGGWYYHVKGAKAADGATAAARDQATEASTDQPSVVATVRLSPGGITRTCTQIGSVHPYEQADLYAKVSGYLAKLHVNYGDRVTKGQVLAEIDDPEVVADAAKAAADVRQAKAAVSQAEAFIEAAKADRDATASGAGTVGRRGRPLHGDEKLSLQEIRALSRPRAKPARFLSKSPTRKKKVMNRPRPTKRRLGKRCSNPRPI